MQPAIPDEIVRHELDAVCSSNLFVRSPQHQRLLRYLVEELLVDRLANLREIHLGVQVFGRSAATFDPATDTIVRVEARRLRARLKRYYASVGVASRVVFDLPLGSYVPALRWLQPLPEAWVRDDDVQRPVLAVLPLDGLGGGDVSAWSDALTEEITDALARSPDIRVVARTSAMQFKGVRRDIREIAHALSADVLIEGSLHQENQQLRAIVQIVAANDGLHLWSDAVVGAVSARFRFFDAVTSTLRLAMPSVLATLNHEQAPSRISHARVVRDDQPNGMAQITTSPAISEHARDLYERGNIAIRLRTTESSARALALFAEVIREAPDFARGHAAYATALLHEVGMTLRSAAEVATEMRAAIDRALALDPQLAEAHATLGSFLLYYQHDWPNAERSLLRAIHFGPSYVSAHRAYAFGLMFMRRFDEADRTFSRARTLDPLDAQTRVLHGLLRFYQRRFDDAHKAFEAMLEADDNNVVARTLLAATCLHSGDVSRAEQLYRETLLRHPSLSIGLCGLAVTLAYAGRTLEAIAVQSALISFSEKSFVSPYQFAMVDCALGNDDAALAWLEKAAMAGDYNFLCSAVDPTFDRLHAAAAWQALMRRFGMPDD